MSDVKRYDLMAHPKAGRHMGTSIRGEWVKAADYDALLAENERLKRAAQTNWNEFAENVGERDQLRAELAAIRGQEPVATVQNRYNADGLSSHIDVDLPAGTKLYALPPQQPDTVSVPRELLERLAKKSEVFDDGSDGADAESARSVAETLRALLSTRQAEEGE